MPQDPLFDDRVQVHLYMEQNDRDRYRDLARRLNKPFSVWVREACEMLAAEDELRVSVMDIKRQRENRRRDLRQQAAG